MRYISLILIIFITAISCSGKKNKSGKTIYYNIGGEPTTLNPVTSVDGYATAVHGYIFESLLGRNRESYEWEPSLAVEWKISDDKKNFDFTLRQGVKFHDGVELTAEDVKFSFDVIFDPKFNSAHKRPYYEGLKEVQVIDKYHVRFVTKSDYYANFEVAAGMSILPKHFYTNKENEKDFNKKIIGTGPYIFAKYDKGQKITLAKNADWWGNHDPLQKEENRIPKMVLRFVQDSNVALELMKKGDLDFEALRAEAFVQKTVGKIWEEKVVKVQATNKAPRNWAFIGWNLKNPIFADKNVRIALAKLFNRDFMIEKFEFNMSLPASGPLYVQSDYADPDVKPIAFNPTDALSLLKKAGWSDSDKDGILDKKINGKLTKLSFTILEPLPEMMKYLTVFKEDASKVGVDIQLKGIEWNAFVKLIDERKFDAVRLAWGGGSVDYDPKQIWHSSSIANGGSNFVSYANPRVDKLIDELRKEYDREKRIKMVREVYRTIADDAPYLFWFNGKYSLYMHSKRVNKPKDTFQYGIGQSFWTLQ